MKKKLLERIAEKDFHNIFGTACINTVGIAVILFILGAICAGIKDSVLRKKNK